MAGFASPMCSYNLVNGKYPCENNHTVNGILKIELGFQAFVFPREPHTVLQSSRLRNSITPVLSPRLRCRPHGPQICEGLVFVTLLSSVSHYEHPTASRLGRHTRSMTVQLGRWPPRLAVFNTRIGDSLKVAHTMSLSSVEIRSRLVSGTQTRAFCR